ncbi:MAG: hypothetical protein HN833_00940 [Elusimicrobiaceae bacterium]|jgi:aspartate-semialdehyde dehydrogenase|nr:hypothetical protein [Elusimicrobiaceae bacterium]MBT3955614.1 hypothetical protein [Elusimicrobiaceae bacterium]MBT4008728.1 hypothetical protein [Elusimicrobiaceae bacterium]MBT4402769.1 hypothetical protein [Elusimicrobiaceae bacterium]MBT4439596.1 hypothetical protein [Elusimicrobiaceae bacterium]
MSIKISIIGANGMVGQTMQKELARIKNKEVEVLAFSRSDEIPPCDIAILCTDDSWSEKLYPIIKDKAKFVIDMSAKYRQAEGIPLVIPEINADAITKDTKLIASPNCTTTGLVMSLNVLEKYQPQEVFFSSYQAMSGGGRQMLEELDNKNSIYHKNVVPTISTTLENGYCKEEVKCIEETKKILNMPNIIVRPHTARVSVETGHSIFTSVRLNKTADLEDIKNLFNSYTGMKFSDKEITPKEIVGKDDVYICRLRGDYYDDKYVNYFITFDNLLKGASLNARQIVEVLLEKFL